MASTLFRPQDRPWFNLVLLGLTLVTTFSAFLFGFGGGAENWPAQIRSSVVFSLSLIFILGAHEMGHYVLARIHRVDTSLPYFIPLPILGVGTLGAVIRIRGRIPHRNALIDIGAAGPLAGLAVAIPLLALGLSGSHFVDTPASEPGFLGPSSLWSLVGRLLHWAGERLGYLSATKSTPPLNSIIFGDNLLLIGLRRLTLGPMPAGQDVTAGPLVVASWFGLLVTMLNLIPIGQLDGGHLTYALFGGRARTIGKLMAVGMFCLALFASAGWLVWLLVTTRVIGFKHPEVVEPAQPVSSSRRVICALCLVALVVCVMPIPIPVS